VFSKEPKLFSDLDFTELSTDFFEALALLKTFFLPRALPKRDNFADIIETSSKGLKKVTRAKKTPPKREVLITLQAVFGVKAENLAD